MYTPIPTWTYSQNSLAAAEAVSVKIPSHGIQGIQDISLWVWQKVNGNWGNNMIRISQWRESHCRTNTSLRRKKEIQKSRTFTVRDPSRKVSHLNKFIWTEKIITEFIRFISSGRISQPFLMIDAKVSKDKHVSIWVYRENHIYVRWNRIKNCAWRRRRWLIQEKELRHNLK